MSEYKSLKSILDRELSLADSKPESENYSTLIDKVVNYSTNLLPRVIDQNKDRLDAFVSCYLFRHIFELSDSISILLRHSIVKPTHILTRSMYEALLELMYLIEAESSNRALCYSYCFTRKDLDNNQKFSYGSEKFKSIQKFLETDVLTGKMKLPKYADLGEKIKQDKIFLNRETFKDIAHEYDRMSKKKKRFKWYSLFNGPTSIFALSEALNTKGSYEIMFRYLSKMVHADSLDSFFNKKDNYLIIEPIRKFDSAGMVAKYTVSFLIRGIIILTNKFRTQELIHFSQYYKDYIQTDFSKISN